MISYRKSRLLCRRGDLLDSGSSRFHKEEFVVGDGNYNHSRAYMEDSTTMLVFTDVARALLDARASIFDVLAKSPRAAEIWQIFERGCMCV